MNNFEQEVADRVVANGQNEELRRAATAFLRTSLDAKYSYNFDWLGRPIIQYPQDIVAIQELVWRVKPDIIFETGIAHGGSLILSASLLAMLDYCDAAEAGTVLDPAKPGRKVLGVDIDIRRHNLDAIQAHPMSNRIEMIQGSSIAADVIEKVRNRVRGQNRVLVFLDSNHTHDHVLAELEAYAQLTTVGSYCVVFDTVVEDLPEATVADRPWGRGNNPKTAVWKFLKANPEFEIDNTIDNKLLVSVAPEGFLRRVR